MSRRLIIRAGDPPTGIPAVEPSGLPNDTIIGRLKVGENGVHFRQRQARPGELVEDVEADGDRTKTWLRQHGFLS